MKRWVSFDFESEEKNENISKNSNSNKPAKKVKAGARGSNFVDRDFNFENKIEPKTVADLAVHNKKVQDVQQWLLDFVVSKKERTIVSMLLLVGPTGCGKTTTINVLCKALNIEVLEWINPIDKDFDFEWGLGQTARLLEFLTDSKYPSLVKEKDTKYKIALVEDYPNSIIRKSEEFHEILDKCSATTRTPIIFICTESNNNNLNLQQTLFPQEIRERYGISTISFNPCSVTLLKNSLKRTQSILQEYGDLFTIPPATVVDAIANSALGDIRCAVNQYHLVCLKGTGELVTTCEKKSGKRKKPSLKTDKVLRDEALGFFHGLGRILNPKRSELAHSWRLQCDLNSLIDVMSSRPSNVGAFLHENYLKYFGDLRDVDQAADVLSQGQLFLESWSEKQEVLIIGLWYCTLGLMVHNEHKVSKWNQIRAPTKFKKITNRNLDTKQLTGADYYYYNVINKTDTFHRFVF